MLCFSQHTLRGTVLRGKPLDPLLRPKPCEPCEPSCSCVTHRYGHFEILQVLLDAGANPLLLDSHGDSPLDLPSTPLGDVRKPKGPLIALLKQHTAK